MKQISHQFEPFAERMQQEGLPLLFIDTFASNYDKLLAGETGLIAESDIAPLSAIPDMEAFPAELTDIGREALAQTVVIKLNGGLGTGMGLEKAKSLLPVKNGYTFLDIIARQAIYTGVPLVLMNSFSTEDDSLAVMKQYGDLRSDLPLSFLQHKAPKIACSDYSPAVWPDEPSLEWCPPGHGDIYTALITQGILAAMLEAGYKTVFVSNADNLGATLDAALAGYFVHNKIPFMMEVTERTEMDKKGGHLAQRRTDGQLILRESAQCSADDRDAFEDILRYKYFNTNNLWIDLEALQKIMADRDNQLGLPLIRNQKTVDPRDSTSTCVFQLETAMGSAISIIDGSQVVRVPRTRFLPVKKSDDLLAVRSDAFVLSDAYEVIPNPERTLGSLRVELDPHFYKFASDLDARFPYGASSLLQCERLHVTGDFLFEEDVICCGSVSLLNDKDTQVAIPAGTILEG